MARITGKRSASLIYEPGNEAALAEIPMGDAAPPEEIANMFVLLLSGKVDHATGTTFDINGASTFGDLRAKISCLGRPREEHKQNRYTCARRA